MSTRRKSRERRQGEALAALLAGAWRRFPPPGRSPTDALPGLAPLVLFGGAGGLAWWRLRQRVACSPRTLRLFREEYRAIAAASLEREEQIASAVACLRAAGVEPILVKGWSVARHYVDPGLRPMGDIDLCVHPDHLDTAIATLTRARLPQGAVDLHRGIPDLPDRSWDAVWQRSQVAALGGVAVRFLGPEDLLRLLCLHFVRHLGFRPLWLVDVAVVLESLRADFDWDYCLSGKAWLSRWVLSAIELAKHLLDARVELPPFAADNSLPAWLAPSVLWQWGAGWGTPPREALAHYLRHPVEFPEALLYRWLNPVRAAWRLGLPPCRSLLLIQAGALLSRPFQAAVRLHRGLTKRRREAPLPFDIHREGVF
jgi:hypothetical protein